MKCGREPGGEKVQELGICPATTFDLTDGYLDGINGGKACAYIFGDFCSESHTGTSRDKKKACAACDFYNEMKYRHRVDFSLQSIIEHIEEKKEDKDKIFHIKEGYIDNK